jgi:hypothetical protein
MWLRFLNGMHLNNHVFSLKIEFKKLISHLILFIQSFLESKIKGCTFDLSWQCPGLGKRWST